MFWKVATMSNARDPEMVSPSWQTLVLVCEKCKGSRHGPDVRAIRKGLKHRLGKRELRIIESQCMDICPDDAIAVCVSKTNAPTRVVLVREEGELDGLAESIR